MVVIYNSKNQCCPQNYILIFIFCRWKPQFLELNKLPPFLRVSAPLNFKPIPVTRTVIFLRNCFFSFIPGFLTWQYAESC